MEVLEDKIISVDDLAALIALPVDTVRSDAYRNPAALPPRVFFPAKGKKQPLRWRMSDVRQWIAALTTAQPPLPDSNHHQDPQPEAPRGAPTMNERMEARRLGITVREFRARRIPHGIRGGK